MAQATGDDRWLAQYSDYRRQVRKAYYRREEDFVSLRSYNDYLEEVEDLVMQLLEPCTRDAAKAKLDKLRATDAALTARNRSRFDEERRKLTERIAQEQYEQHQQLQQRIRAEQAAAEEQARSKAELQDKVAAGKASASEMKVELRKREAAASSLALKIKEEPQSDHRVRDTSNERFEYVPTMQAYQQREVLCQPLEPQDARDVPKFLQSSSHQKREAYEDDPVQLRLVCKAGGYLQDLWRARYRQTAFDAAALLW